MIVDHRNNSWQKDKIRESTSWNRIANLGNKVWRLSYRNTANSVVAHVVPIAFSILLVIKIMMVYSDYRGIRIIASGDRFVIPPIGKRVGYYASLQIEKVEQNSEITCRFP